MANSTNSRIPLGLFIGTGAVIFLANAGLLVLQLVAGRLLAPFIGSSIETWTCVIGVFLTGIAIGNWLGGRLADRFPSPKTVGVLLILSGLSSLGMIACYEFTLSSGFYKSLALGPRIPALAFLFCLPPAMLLSLLTPVTIKLLLPDVGSAGRIAGLVFALSTLGCLIGNYFTGFWLMAHFTLNEITQGVGIGLMALGAPILFYPRINRVSASTPGTSASEPVAENLIPDGEWNFKNNLRLAYAIVFIASFCGMSLELTGSRVLAPILGVSLFTWTGIIGVMLAGTCCGNYLGGILADRGIGPALSRCAFIVAILFGAAGGPIVLGACLDDFDPYANVWNEFRSRVLGALIGILIVFRGIWLSKRRRGPALLAAILGGLVGMALAHVSGRAIDTAFALPAFTAFHQSLSKQLGFNAAPLIIHGIGLVIGVAIAVLFIWDAPANGERVTRSGALSGTLFIASLTTLAILLLVGIYAHYLFMANEVDIVQKVLVWTFGLFFLPMLLLGAISPQVIRLSVPDVASAGRVAGSIYAWSTTGAITGTFVSGYFLIGSVGTFRVLLILALLLTSLSFVVGRLWKNNVMLYAASIIGAGAMFGLYIIGYGSNRYDLETKYYAIIVRHNPDDGEHRVRLMLDHLTHSFVDLKDPTWLGYQHEYVQGELLGLPYSRHKNAHLLIIGGGGYTFPRYVQALMPEVDVDVVEIDAGVTKIAYDKLNLPNAAECEKRGLKPIRSHHMDGRQFVSEQAPKEHYQLVVQDAVNDLSVPYHLMTKEYNDAVKATLTPDGAYLLTLIDSLDHGQLWRAAVTTMRQTFKYVYVLGPDGFRVNGHIKTNRSVYIIYGSDHPIDVDAIRAATRRFRSEQVADIRDLTAILPRPFNVVSVAIDEWRQIDWLHVLETEALDDLLRDRKVILLTDQYCPVDNLMSDVFRERERGRR